MVFAEASTRDSVRNPARRAAIRARALPPLISFGTITVALACDGQGRDSNHRIASERRADADNRRCPAVQYDHCASVRIGVPGFMRPVICD